jgi:hypothetical protein
LPLPLRPRDLRGPFELAPLESQIECAAKSAKAAIDAGGGSGLREKYENIVRRIPRRWRDYCDAQVKYDAERYAQWYKNTGTPRKDDIAAEAQQLKANGKSYHQIAIALNQKYGPDTTNSEAVRARLRSRKRQATPDKTCSISSVE